MTTHEVGVIIGTTEFIVTGSGLSLSQTGEKLEIVADDGSVSSACTYKPTGSEPPQFLRANAATAVPAGTYRLRLTTRGYSNPNGDLIAIEKKVTVKAA